MIITADIPCLWYRTGTLTKTWSWRQSAPIDLASTARCDMCCVYCVLGLGPAEIRVYLTTTYSRGRLRHTFKYSTYDF